ncbi:MAG TPA: hypothetical protein EYQ82_05905, partial [Dehalococcoidia bacterium]|nr:hypothetical protein [Dehalococcoidia bacterium]
MATARRTDPRSAGRERPGRPGQILDSPPAPLGSQSIILTEAMSLLESTDYMVGQNDEQVRVTLTNLLQRAAPTDKEIA